MKAKTARKAVRHAKPRRKNTRARRRAPAGVPSNKKEVVKTVAAGSETTTDAFGVPVEFVALEMEPAVELIEVFEVEGGGNEDEE